MELYETGLVKRYHTHTRLNEFNQNNAQHQWGCAALIEVWCPHPTVNLFRAALFHDTGERVAGDLSYQFKRDNPEIAVLHAHIERDALLDLIGEFNLTHVEGMWLKFVDRVECLLHVNRHMSQLLLEPDWQQSIIDCQVTALELGVNHLYVAMLQGFDIYRGPPLPDVTSATLHKWGEMV